MEAPFKPGDRVVYINVSDPTGIMKNGRYTIESIYWCCSSAQWRVHLVEISMSLQFRCIYCKSVAPGWLAKDFRKIDDLSDHTTESLLEELSEPVRELQPVLINGWFHLHRSEK